MLIKKLRYYFCRRSLGVFSLAVLFLSGLSFLIFDYYLSSVGQEIMSSWIKSEAVEIQEGNLLTSITKNQRVLFSSQFVKGTKLIDTTSGKQNELIAFGSEFEPLENFPTDIGKLSIHPNGFLRKQTFYRVPSNTNLILVSEIRSDILTRAFFGLIAIFIGFLVFLFAAIRKLETREIELREKILIEKNRSEAAANEKKIALGELAARLAHDIRSPLNTLESVSTSLLSTETEQERLFKKAIQRIREISSEVMQTYKFQASDRSNETQKAEPYLLVSLVDDLVEEKRHQYKDSPVMLRLNYDQTSGMAISNLIAGDFKRHISNLIDNAAEATDLKGNIEVSVTSNDQFSVIQVSDNGKGIPQDKISRIGEKGFTFGKENGSGLGLYYLKKSIQDQGGIFELASQENVGTTVTVKLLRSQDGVLGQKSLDLTGFDKILLLDDDLSVHEGWKQRFGAVSTKCTLEHAFDPDAAFRWLKRQPRHERILLLSDFELHHKINGLEFIEQSKNHVAASVLVTTNCSDSFVRAEAHRSGVPLLPKSLISSIQIS